MIGNRAALAGGFTLPREVSWSQPLLLRLRLGGYEIREDTWPKAKSGS